MDRYNGEYDDIINMTQPVNPRRVKMTLHDRAAQFAPFAALTGFDSRIGEAARLTDKKPELSETEIEALNEKIGIIIENISSRPELEVVYFVKDLLKEGGSLEHYIGCIRKLDSVGRKFVFEDCKIIPADDIIDIRSEIFDVYNGQNQEN